jgi:hypothetical protein
MRILAGLFLSLLLLSPGPAIALTPEQEASAIALSRSLAPPAEPSGAFVIEDVRARNTKRVRYLPMGALGGLSCNAGIVQLGDNGFASDRIARLENALSAAFPGERGNLVVRRYDLYLNRGAETDRETRQMSMGVNTIVVTREPPLDYTAQALWRRPKCDADRMLAGWFDSSDLTNNYPPIVAEIDVSVLGVDVRIGTAFSPDMDPQIIAVFVPGMFTTSPVFETMLQRAMNSANARVTEAISASRTPPQAAE